jgi:uncharacterized protein
MATATIKKRKIFTQADSSPALGEVTTRREFWLIAQAPCLRVSGGVCRSMPYAANARLTRRWTAALAPHVQRDWSLLSKNRNHALLGQRMDTQPVPQSIIALERPCPALWKYYVITAVLTGPAIIITLPFYYFRYSTLRYRFDQEGIHMRVGILFRREVNLTYARIQDIHLRSNFLQRWLGLANVQIQTASGSAGAELVIEGFKEFEPIRDFLYTRMRGYPGRPHSTTAAANAPGPSAAIPPATDQPEMISLLLSIRDELRRTREALESRKPLSSSAPSEPPSRHV